MKWKESIKDTPHLNSFLHIFCILMLLKWFRRIVRHFGRENPNIFNHCGGRSFRWIIRQNFMLNTFYESLVHLHEKYFWQPRSLWDNLNSNGLLIALLESWKMNFFISLFQVSFFGSLTHKVMSKKGRRWVDKIVTLPQKIRSSETLKDFISRCFPNAGQIIKHFQEIAQYYPNIEKQEDL